MKIKETLKRISALALSLALGASLCLVSCSDIPEDPVGSESGSVSDSDIPVIAGTDTPPGEVKKRVALTFDDGPHNVRTREIVDELDKYGFHATFFVVGNRVDGEAYRGGDTLKYVVDHGNEVGIHGYTHEYYYDTCDEDTYLYELSATADAIREYAGGYEVKLMRPVGGKFTEERLKACPYASVMWGVDSNDWQYKYGPDSELSEDEKRERVNTIVDNVMSTVSDGSIILMHDIYLSTSDAVKIILERLHAEGYEVVTVSELIGDVQPGVEYRHAP